MFWALASEQDFIVGKRLMVNIRLLILWLSLALIAVGGCAKV